MDLSIPANKKDISHIRHFARTLMRANKDSGMQIRDCEKQLPGQTLFFTVGWALLNYTILVSRGGIHTGAPWRRLRQSPPGLLQCDTKMLDSPASIAGTIQQNQFSSVHANKASYKKQFHLFQSGNEHSYCQGKGKSFSQLLLLLSPSHNLFCKY